MATRFRLLCCLILLSVVGSSSESVPSFSLQSLVPSFAWSNHRLLDNDFRRISYQTLSSEELAQTVKREFVWTGASSSEERSMDVVLVFIGHKLRSGDVSRKSAGLETSDLLEVLSTAVTTSNSSVSFPYVAPPRDGVSLTEVLLRSVITDLDEVDESRIGEVITVGACVYKRAGTRSLDTLDALKDYLSARKEAKAAGNTDIVVVCSSSEGSQVSKRLSEGEILDDVLWSLDEVKTRYVALYATDLVSENVSSLRSRGRQLGSVIYKDDVYCNEVCQTKALLLEGLMVSLTLLIILISGLCCMAGITSPSRFEQSKEGQ